MTLSDFRKASSQVRPTVSEADVAFHEQWNRDHGAGAVGAAAADDDGDEW